MKIQIEGAYVKKSEHKKEDYGEWTEATVIDGESEITLRSYDLAMDLTTLKPKTLVNMSLEGEFGKANQYGIRFNVNKILK